MKRRSLYLISCLLYCFIYGFGQQTQPESKRGKPQKDEAVRLSVTLVQTDVVVVDKPGRQVTDLVAEDFEILEDGRAQKITNFSYINQQQAAQAVTEAGAVRPADAPPAPTTRLRPDQVRRTVALVVDDLGLSHESINYVRQALKKFVDTQMQPGDLVAIIRTGAGMGALQQFTADRRQLYAAIERVRFNPSGRSRLNAFLPVTPNSNQLIFSNINENKMNEGAIRWGETSTDSMDALKPKVDYSEDLYNFTEEVFAVGTLGAVNFIVRGLRQLPGRKSLILFSDGFQLYNRADINTRIYDSLQRLTDMANRASVVIYAVDPRGLQPLTMTAADDTSGQFFGDQDQANKTYQKFFEELQDNRQKRRDEFIQSQHGLNYLTAQTGGFYIKNTNDLNRGISRVLEDQKGYYLIGYVPDEATFTSKGSYRTFHEVKVNVKRAGLRVRTRSGFFGIVDEQAHPTPRTPAQQLYAAIISPFTSGDVRMRMSSLFGYDQKAGPFAQSIVHIDARDLTFKVQPGGFYKAVIDIMAITFRDNGQIFDQDDHVYTIMIPGKDYQRALEAGLVYVVTLAVKKPGAYQLRLAVRDHTSERVGSSNQYIEIPDVKKGRLTLSGITLRGVEPEFAGHPAVAGAPDAQAATGRSGKIEETDPQSGPAVRRLRRGMALEYAYMIYNARLDEKTSRPQLQTQIRLFRDNREVFAGAINDFEPASRADLKRLIAGGRLLIGADLVPGEYVLQVLVSDRLTRGKQPPSSQWIDFEIVE